MELWDIYDKNRNKTGEKHERGTPLSKGHYHLVASAWIMNDKGEFLIGKRHEDKKHPNLWECPGGAVLAGETSLEGVLREVKEEIGIDLEGRDYKLLKSERRDEFNDFFDAWLFTRSFELDETTLQPEEVTDVKWVTKQ